MKDKLDWLKDNMPEGWRLKRTGDQHKVMLLNERDGGFELWPMLGDIGLAPFTALLKQELIRRKKCIDLCLSDGSAAVLEERCERPFGWGDTEFEAVVSAYKAMRDE